ncbi:hypothetical protein H3C66_03935 [Patescibacteria group bacterium]|nr:hypothetical protein [Patescibacteria group bacterium]
MYHIVVIAPNQVETPLFQRVRECFTLRKTSVILSFVSETDHILNEIYERKPDYIFLSASYPPTEQLEKLTSLAQYVRKTRRVVPLIYLIDWTNPLSSVLGTSWSGQVGVLHGYSNNAEIIDLFQRLDGWGVTVGQ